MQSETETEYHTNLVQDGLPIAAVSVTAFSDEHTELVERVRELVEDYEEEQGG